MEDQSVERVSIVWRLKILLFSVTATIAIINAGKRPISRQTPPVTHPRGRKKIVLSSPGSAKLATLARRRQMARNFTLPFPYYKVTDERNPQT
jgi:hypothetical protein